MKRIPYIYILILPYLILVALFFMIFFHLREIGFILFCIVSGSLCSLGVVALVICNTLLITDKTNVNAAMWFLIIKILHIPAHGAMVVLAGGMLNPWLFLFAGVPIFISICFSAFVSTMNIGYCVNCYKYGKQDLSTSVIYGMLSFVYVIDIIIAIIQVVKYYRRKPIAKQL